MFKRRLPPIVTSRGRFTDIWGVCVLYVLWVSFFSPIEGCYAREEPIDPIGSVAIGVESGSVELSIGGEERIVSVDPFDIQPRLVSYGEYQRYLGDVGAATRPAYWSYFSDDPKRPLVGVNLQDVLGFLEWLNAKGEGRIYRLPTEAEWRLAYRQSRLETQPSVGEFLLDYYSEDWRIWPIEEGQPFRNPFGPVIGVHGPKEARNFVGVRVSREGEVERDPLAPDTTGLGFGFRLASSLEGPGPLGERLIRQAQLKQAQARWEEPPSEGPPAPPQPQPVPPPPAPPPALLPTATNTMAPTATNTNVPPAPPAPTMAEPTPTATEVAPTVTPPPLPMAAPTATQTPPAPSPTPASARPARPFPAGLPPYLQAEGISNTDRFEAKGCSLEVSLPIQIKANEFTRFRLMARNGFPEPKKLSISVSLEVEAIAHIEQGPGFTFHPAGTARQSLQRPGARFGETATQLPLLELADAEVPAGATRVLDVPIRFSQTGKATLQVRATFLAAAPEPRLDLNLPEMGFPDQLGFPSKAYEIEIQP